MRNIGLQNINISIKPEQIEYVDVGKLKLRKNRVRQKISLKNMPAMMQSLKYFGFMQPLEINQNNEIVVGNRRFEAAKIAWIKKIPVVKRESVSEWESMLKELFSDLTTEKLSIMDKAFAFQFIMDQVGMTKYALAKFLSLSHTHVCKTLAILKANKKTLKLIEDGKISERKVATILYRLKDKTKEDYVINEIIKKRFDIVQAGNFVAEINNPEIFKKHFLARVKAFETSLKNFQEKANTIGLNKNDKEEVEASLQKLGKLLN